MRKVSYNVAGETFTSYAEALAFKAQAEAVFDTSMPMETVLEEVWADPDTEAKMLHRAKVNEVVHAGYSIPMKGGVQ